MELVYSKEGAGGQCALPEVSREVTDDDSALFFKVVSVDISEDAERIITQPQTVLPRQKNVLAIHWHPEFIPMDLIVRRVNAMFPNKDEELIIPTQHNDLLFLGDYAGVEVDCYSAGFNQKVQLLLHFQKERVQDAAVLRSMLEHTFKYRSSQLFAFIEALAQPDEEILNKAAEETGAGEDIVEFVRIVTAKIKILLEANYDQIPIFSIKNKVIKEFFNGLRPVYGNTWINRCQAFLQEVKKLVKLNFPFKYFYRTSEIIEEVRSLGGGIVIPHPEQFWPILLADYDVDGYEVWNPQSRRYTEFLIDVVNKTNHRASRQSRRLMIFMGDDTHMSEKIKPPEAQNQAKAAREIGYQPAWDDLAIRKKLILAKMDRGAVIEEYIARLTS
ncbi:hypothetical protein SAMN02745216_04720 [Desulfatibacillum alkenivorans DSM 16219]|jgi:hypothetical protein|uniref:Uncharacterized protein n=1 Tax=Desulfatibacillum alkenivorans DSM 16219 TaxID=1121393 RepID=A0A1M6YC65_9BACT|nr:hypothetical protein [Desulfatibacillum alkenivorans]SHL15730.1 hypothetical protein SAMN02745216_04720 [Desulfatibacillum alkenivorans DSM 16219]